MVVCRLLDILVDAMTGEVCLGRGLARNWCVDGCLEGGVRVDERVFFCCCCDCMVVRSSKGLSMFAPRGFVTGGGGELS